MSYIIGIGGASQAGKSSLAQKIKKRLPTKQVLLLDMDNFVFPASTIPNIKDRTDWERPESVNFNKLRATIQEQRHNHDLIIVEGILVFAHESLLQLYDCTIWMQISKKTFLERRRKEKRWGPEPEWFLEHVWDSYLKYGQHSNTDFVLSGEQEIPEEELDRILVSS